MQKLRLPVRPGMIKATSDAWLKGWDERNGGNLTLRLDEADIAPFSADFHENHAILR